MSFQAIHIWLVAAAILLFSGIGIGTGYSGAPKPGDVVFQTTFDSDAERSVWSQTDGANWITGYQGTVSLQISVASNKAKSGNMIQMPIDLSKYRGCRLLFQCMVRAKDVSKPSDPWLGVKFMLHYTSPDKGAFWQNQNNVFGTFDWKKVQFTSRIAEDAATGQISLGLQGSSGSVAFDCLQISVVRGSLPKRPTPPTNPGPVFKGHHLPRLRGVMSPSSYRDDDLKVLGTEWNANVIRWQMTRNWGKSGTDRDLEEYDRWLNSELDDLQQVLDACQKYGIKVVVDMHSPPGGRRDNMDLAIFHEPKYQQHYVHLWREIAKRFKGRHAIWGYDLVNEPVQNLPPQQGVADYLGAQVLAAKAIRSVDADVPIFIEACQWDSADGFRELRPVDVPNVIYQVHMYVPHEFTHQGVHNKKTGIAYPGTIGEKFWNKDALRKTLAPVREFQQAYNVHIYVGEFSAIRWAPGAATYLRDCISLFEEYDWDWTYHAYREWDGWSVEHGSDRASRDPADEPTDRKKLLLEWFGKNKKPSPKRRAK